MKSICMCVGLHLPYHLKWYWPSEGYSYPQFGTYFDKERISNDFNRILNNIGRTNWILNHSIKNGAAYTLHMSGVFLEQCDDKILESFKDLSNTNKVSFVTSPYYHSLSSLYDDLQEFEIQVKKHMDKIKMSFGFTPKTFINPQLMTTGNINHILKNLGLICVISEGSHNIIKETPSKIYGQKMPTLLRNIELSDDINKHFSNRFWKDYPLTTDKFISWIEKMEGDIVTLYIDYGTICWNEDTIGGMFQFLTELPVKLAKKGINMILPEEAVKIYDERVDLKTLDSETAARYGMNSMLGNHAQHFYLKELSIMLEELKNSNIKDSNLHNIFGYLQQSDIFLDMDNTHNIMGYENAVNYLAILSDFRRAILEARS